MPRKPPKKVGEWVEQIFLAMVLGLRLNASRPIGDSTTYDAIVEGRSRRLYRVQVKSTRFSPWRGAYQVMSRRCSLKGYTTDDVDFMAVYVIPEKLWYLIPARALRAKPSIYLYLSFCSAEEVTLRALPRSLASAVLSSPK